MATAPHRPDVAAVKERQQEAWASGDYAMIGAKLVVVSEELCEAVDLHPRRQVLDVATGSGNTALAGARRFCAATGIDYVPALLERGRVRAEAEGLRVDFREGDAEDLPFPEASFDYVLSTFGVMFAPDQERAAGELLRVCRPGGRIGLSCWTPDGFAGEMFRIIGTHAPPPPGVASPFAWGTEGRIQELFDGGVGRLETTRRVFVFRYPSARYYVDFMRSYFGPLHKAFNSLDEDGREKLERDLIELIGRLNRSGDETMIVPGEYLQTVAVRG